MGVLKPLLGNLKITYSALFRFFTAEKRDKELRKLKRKLVVLYFCTYIVVTLL